MVSVEEVEEVWDAGGWDETVRDCILDVMEEVGSDSDVFFRGDDCLVFCFFGSGGLEI